MTDARDDATPLDDFLAAPEEVTSNLRERAKLIERRRREEARQARERATKAAEPPTLEDVLADVVRVAEDEATNPWHEFRAISQRRYELYGHYPIEQVLRFGRFEHVKQMAGLATTVGTRRLLHARTNRSLEEHDRRYMERYLAPHVGKFPELTRAATGWRLALVISDLHGLFLDPFTWEAFLQCVAEMQPDVVHLNGDVVDGLEISTHPKVPGASVPLQLELDFARHLFRELREVAAPGCRLVWGAGNHFLDRLVRYLTQVARGLAGLRALRVDQLVDLGDLEVELAQGGSFVSPPGQESQLPQLRLWDSYLVTHGTRLGRYPAAAELAQHGCNGTSGHVHRASVHYGANAAHRGLTWMSTPMACVDDVGRYYVKGHAGWQRGFGVAKVGPRGRVHHYPVVTDDGVADVDGMALEAGPDVPPDDMLSVRRWWCERFDLDPGSYL